ncbi:MAG: hypothetical protein DMF90_26660, partial [Acidobacteria bacterium]
MGGRAQATFGGGSIIEPIQIYLAGRVTREYPSKEVSPWANTKRLSLSVSERWANLSSRSRPNTTQRW